MELPNWVVDEIIAPAKPVAVRLVLHLYRHGRPVVGADGSRRVYWKGSAASLARVCGVSRFRLIEAEAELVEAGFLTVHEPNRAGASHAISAAYDLSQNVTPSRIQDGTHDGDDPDPDPDPDPERDPSSLAGPTTTITQVPREAGVSRIVTALANAGVSSPNAWLAQFGADACDAVLGHLERVDPGAVKNPAGWLYRLLQSPGLTVPPTRSGPASFEARKERYAGGAWASVVKYR